jgi:hypothetical protein
MNTIQRASADLREAESALKAYVPREKLEEAVRIAEQAVLSAARNGSVAGCEAKGEASDAMLNELEAEALAEETFSEDEAEADQGVETIEATDEVAEVDASDAEIFEESNLAQVSATAADVVGAISEAIPAETIDATDEVTVEEAIEAVETAPNPNGMLGKNYPNTAA